MANPKKNLADAIILQADNIMTEIQKAGSMIVAVKAAARANGFVLGLLCSNSVTYDVAQRLQAEFDISTKQKLKELSA
ncbi:hypothetical protein [Pseudomonas sp. R5-89-07]|uniref:hypothetical protein n=1 Tax=Pseudomonas sp. R5-89-07 TaxID=658644 RepID=UPI000F55CD7D|nr:hypothetical protein [Pseudomonas sp. R5-89-07]AZF05660.1 hypothetical protein C4J94_2893 [Pseudomonas sp. R5-89-07]